MGTTTSTFTYPEAAGMTVAEKYAAQKKMNVKKRRLEVNVPRRERPFKMPKLLSKPKPLLIDDDKPKPPPSLPKKSTAGSKTIKAHKKRDNSSLRKQKPKFSVKEARQRAYNQRWNEMFERLQVYRKEHGDCLVPSRYVDRTLAQWVSQQRNHYRDKKIEPDRLEKLEAIGFVWRVRPTNTLMKRLEEAVMASRKENAEQERGGGDADTDTDTKRGAYTSKRWKYMFEKLQAYHKEHGDCLVPKRYVDQALASWVYQQRSFYRDKKIDPGHVAQLESIGFVWRVKTADKQLQRLEEAVMASRNASAQKERDGGDTDTTSTVSSSSSGTLDERKTARQRWNKMFEKLQVYQKEHGNCLVPKSTDPGLADWIREQRDDRTKGTIERDHVAQLESIGFDWTVVPRVKSQLQRLEEAVNGTEDYTETTQLQPVEQAAYGDANKENTNLRRSYDKSHIGQAVGFGDKTTKNANEAFYGSNQPQAELQLQHHEEADNATAAPTESTQLQRLEQAAGSGSTATNNTNQPSPVDVEWNLMFEKLKQYKKKYKTCLVPRQHNDKDFVQWIENQRTDSKCGKLSQDKWHKLDKLGFSWATKPPPNDWNIMYERLKDYQYRNGSCVVSIAGGGDRSLLNWCSHQRRCYKLETLSAEREALLNAVGFVWDISKPTASLSVYYSGQQTRKKVPWNEMFERLQDYKRDMGDCLVSYKYEDSQLANWVKNQRTLNNSNKLDPDRKAKLDAIGFVFDVGPSISQVHTQRWEEMFRKLQVYKEQYGDCLPSNGYEDTSLVNWVRLQRTQNNSNKLVPERKEKLDSIGFVWDAYVRTHRWDEMFEKLQEHKEKQGDCLLGKGCEDTSLLNWVRLQRTQNKSNKLDPERKAKLDAIGFVWDARSLTSKRYVRLWDEMFERLQEYKRLHGDCCVGKGHEDQQLGFWVRSQRTQNNLNKLDPDRRSKLDSIGFVWSAKTASSSPSSLEEWTEIFEKLQKYKEQFGNCLVPSRFADKSLVNWVRTQRTLCHANKLSSEQKRKLDLLGFVWTVGK